jgi:hypothetical protein
MAATHFARPRRAATRHTVHLSPLAAAARSDISVSRRVALAGEIAVHDGAEPLDSSVL